MSEQKFSDFTLNFNPGARSNDKAPTLKGKATVLHAGSVTEYDVAAWGPNAASTGGPDFYNVTFTPRDPALAARQLKTQPGPVRNKVEGFELTKIGSGRIFERTDAQLADNPKLPKFYGHGLVLLHSTEPVYIDLSAWNRGEFYSGNANLHDQAAASATRGEAATAVSAADATAAKLEAIKAELRKALQGHLQRDRSAAALAILEVALELYITDLGDSDAKKLVRSAFDRVASAQYSHSIRAALTSVARSDSKGEA